MTLNELDICESCQDDSERPVETHRCWSLLVDRIRCQCLCLADLYTSDLAHDQGHRWLSDPFGEEQR